jgi:hypothetical protein
MTLEDIIGSHVGEVRTEAFDFTFGEISNLHASRELIIDPEYQRAFRWSLTQKSQLIESILLELPIPQIFVIENHDGVFELIDGLQRVSTVLQFIDPTSIRDNDSKEPPSNPQPLKLEGCSLIDGLDGLSFSELPLPLRLRLKRSSIRTVVIKKQSKSFLRYEMFKRLNTGGSNLEPQEIRNCSARMVGESGVEFYKFLLELAESESFKPFSAHVPKLDKEKRAVEELVLRFFALKNREWISWQRPRLA